MRFECWGWGGREDGGNGYLALWVEFCLILVI